MPFYVFECLACKKQYTVLATWKDKDKAVCPDCGSAEKKERFDEYRLGQAGTGSGNGSCKPTFHGG